MRILQLTSDWKWTGPAAPMLELLCAQRERGHSVELVCPTAPKGSEPSLLGEARRAGVEPALELSRHRGSIWWRDAADARRLRALVDRRGFDVIHTWHTRDHVLALRAAAGERRAGRTCVVRSYRRAEAIPGLPWNRWLFGSGTDGLLCVSPESARGNARLRGGRPLAGAFGAVDLGRFSPGPAPAGLRERLGLSSDHLVVAIAARVQPRRRFDLLLGAMARLASRDASARLLVIGRGSRLDAVARRPAERLGVADRVVFAGYRRCDYADVLRTADVFTLLVPGSDGGCRALLEAAACGLPAVTTRRGALPEIVSDGESGLVVAEDEEALGAAWGRLLSDAPLRARLGAAARRRAERHFARARLAETVDRLYADALSSRAR